MPVIMQRELELYSTNITERDRYGSSGGLTLYNDERMDLGPNFTGSTIAVD